MVYLVLESLNGQAEAATTQARAKSGHIQRSIKGKVLAPVSITNELDSRYIFLESSDQAEPTITLDLGLTGKLELFNCRAVIKNSYDELDGFPMMPRCGGRSDEWTHR